jgi:hypothetical protein
MKISQEKDTRKPRVSFFAPIRRFFYIRAAIFTEIISENKKKTAYSQKMVLNDTPQRR